MRAESGIGSIVKVNDPEANRHECLGVGLTNLRFDSQTQLLSELEGYDESVDAGWDVDSRLRESGNAPAGESAD